MVKVMSRHITPSMIEDQDTYNDNHWDLSGLLKQQPQQQQQQQQQQHQFTPQPQQPQQQPIQQRICNNNINLPLQPQQHNEIIQSIKMSLKDWNQLVNDKEILKNEYPFSINSSQYHALANPLLVELKCIYDILVFKNDTKVPLLPASMALTSSSILYSTLITDTPVTLDDTSCVAAEDGALKFFPDQTGRYQVTLVVFSNYLSNKRNGFGFSTPISTSNTITTTVHSDVQIKVDPSSNHQEEIINDPSLGRYTKSTSLFPPTSYIKIQWTELEISSDYNPTTTPLPAGDTPPLPSAEQTVAALSSKNNNNNKVPVSNKSTVSQYSLCSVGEGVILFTNSIKYSIVSGSLSTLEVIVGASLKVQSVEGLDIKKYDVYPITSGGKVTDQLVKVALNSPVETSYVLTIVSEIEMNGTSDSIIIPSVRCKGSEISRENGFLVVESTANVQVDQVSRELLTLIDKTEVPSALIKKTSGPILLAYKFLDPNYKIGLNITKHADLPVLVSVCETAHFISTLSTEGSLLKKLVLSIRNTQKQYIRIKIPHQFDIWSTIVAHKAVKPALDESGTIMIPLNKSKGLEQGIQNKFTVELVYKHKDDVVMSNRGILNISFPNIDIPISNLYVSLYLPKTFKYGDIVNSNIKEVFYFKATPPMGLGDAVGGINPTSNTRGVARRIPFAAIKEKQDNGGGFVAAQGEGGDDGDEQEGGGGGGDTAGLKPVIVNIPRAGTWIRLERQLVLSTEININIKYKKTNPIGKWLEDQLTSLWWSISEYIPTSKLFYWALFLLIFAYLVQKIVGYFSR